MSLFDPNKVKKNGSVSSKYILGISTCDLCNKLYPEETVVTVTKDNKLVHVCHNCFNSMKGKEATVVCSECLRVYDVDDITLLKESTLSLPTCKGCYEKNDNDLSTRQIAQTHSRKIIEKIIRDKYVVQTLQDDSVISSDDRTFVFKLLLLNPKVISRIDSNVKDYQDYCMYAILSNPNLLSKVTLKDNKFNLIMFYTAYLSGKFSGLSSDDSINYLRQFTIDFDKYKGLDDYEKLSNSGRHWVDYITEFYTKYVEFTNIEDLEDLVGIPLY